MQRTIEPRVVVVTRPTEYELLIARHATREQARFFLETRDQSLELVEERHAAFRAALDEVTEAIPARWRVSRVARADLDRFLFGPEDLVVAVGQDGLVANLAKYLDGQPVIGVNPDPGLYEGVLVPHPAEAATDLLPMVARGSGAFEERTMVVARMDDGQELLALNEIFVGTRTHQSARYRLAAGGANERQSSSGVIVSTGTGATGWALSINRQRGARVLPPDPEESALAWFVREPWPSVSTGAELDGGRLDRGQELLLVSEMNDDGVVFGDGIEADRLAFGYGQTVKVGVARKELRLLI